MPPKNASKGGASQSKKADQKKKEKIIEDKTFGLKNKKGSKQQKFISQVETQVKSSGNKTAKQLEKEREDRMKAKDTKKQALAEINDLFRPVQQQATTKGADPKSVLCAFFKQGGCSKGAKCKFSHDLNIERKSEKRSAYVDMRDEDKETSEDWDEEKLKEVIDKKHGKEKSKPTTEIVCKYFLDAVENGKYGWFWTCPNGGNCIYRHALPPGFVLKKDKKKLENSAETISLEELIEKERAALGHNTTKVTLETFLAWKKKKLKEREEAKQKDTEKKQKDYKSGKDTGLSGREMFTFNPDLATNNDMDDGDESYDVQGVSNTPQEGDEEEEQIHFREIDYNSLLAEYRDIDNDNISQAAPNRLESLQQNLTNGKPAKEPEGAAGGPESAGTSEGAVAIDEDLFDGDDEDLDDLDQQLDDLSIS